MANDRISDLTPITHVNLADLIEVSEPTGGSPPYASKSALLSQILAAAGAGQLAMLGLDGDPGEDGMIGPPGPAGSGGGGGGSTYYTAGNVTPDTHPANPTTRDDEFEGASLSGQWSQVGAAGTAGYSVFAGSLLMTGASGSVNINNSIIQPIAAPNSPWRFRCKQRMMILSDSTFSGICVVQGSTGKGYYYGRYTGDPTQIIVNAQNTYAGAGVSSPLSPANFGYSTGAFMGPEIYLDISWDGATNLTLRVSADGTNFQLYGTFSTAGFVPDSFGLFGGTNSVSSSTDASVAYDWIRDITNGYTPAQPVTLQSLANLSPDTHPSSPTQWDDEFEEIALSSQWVSLNQGGATLTVSGGWLKYAADTTGGSNHQALVEALSPTVWTFQAKIIGFNGLVTGTNSSCGMCLGNSATPVYVDFGMYCSASGTMNILVQRMGNLTSGESNVLLGGAVPASLKFGVTSSDAIYLQLRSDGTNIYFSMSPTGIPGTFVQVYTETIAAYLGSINRIGLTVNNAVVGAGTYGPATLLCDWIRRVA